jgi:integrase
MAKSALTAAAVERLKPPAAGQKDHYDSSHPGLVLRVSKGAKTFVFMYRMHSTRRRLTLGRYPAMTLAEAREAWREHRKAVDRGEDPTAKHSPKEFCQLAGVYLNHKRHKRSISEVERAFNHDIKPAWEGRLVADINRRDCRAVINAIADRGAETMSRRTQAYLRSFFEWAVKNDHITVNPMKDLPKRGEETEREHVLTDDELAQVWHAAVKRGYPFGHAIQLLILTGARLSEIGDLKWREVKGDELVIEQTKVGKGHHIPLSDLAQDILDSVPRLVDSEFVFTTTGKTPSSGWSKAKTHIDKLLPDGFSDWRLHDIRRTVATGLQRMGTGLQVVEAVLGHTTGSRKGIVKVYQRYDYAPEKRRALNMWAAHVASVLSDDHEKAVIPLFTKT